MDNLVYGISIALGSDQDYDLDAIARDIRATGARTVDDVPGDLFWQIAEAHALTDADGIDPDSAAVFREEVAAACAAERLAGTPAVWRRGGVTIAITGASRVRFDRPFGEARITSTTGHQERVTLGHSPITTWDQLWDHVSPLLEEWSAAVAETRATAERHARKASELRELAAKEESGAHGARNRLAALLGEAPGTFATDMTGEEVAEYLGIQPGGVRRQMSRWGIEARYDRGTSGRAVALYPAEEVRAKAAARPGQGKRTDLHRA